MTTIKLYNDCSCTETRVPNQFIDKYMPEANGEFVKVYLYLLRSIESNASMCTISAIADRFDHTEKDVIRALKYWERQHLISLDYDSNKEICGICFIRLTNDDNSDMSADNTCINPASQMISQVSASNEASLASSFDMEKADGVISKPLIDNSMAAGNVTITHSPVSKDRPASPGVAAVMDSLSAGEAAEVPSKKEYTLDEVKNFRQNSDISELFFIIETYLKHPLSSIETNTILYWYQELAFSTELIEYLVEYCISKGHSNVRYMDKVAFAWKENNICTVNEAKENAAIHSKTYYTVMKAVGISGRNLNDKEMAYLTKWTKEYKFDNSIIKEACERTISAIHQPSLEYTETILENWFKSNVHTLDDIKPLDEAFSKAKKASQTAPSSSEPKIPKSNKFNNFNQRKYDYDQLEKVLLTTSVQ